MNDDFPCGAVLIVLILLFGIWALWNGRTDYNKIKPGDKLTVMNIDGCEYFKIRGANWTYSLCHKGNCTNSIHYQVKLER